MGRPPKSETDKREPHKVWLSPAEWAAVKSMAELAKVAPADYLREAVLRTLEGLKTTTPVVVLRASKLADSSESEDSADFRGPENYYARSSFEGLKSHPPEQPFTSTTAQVASTVAPAASSRPAVTSSAGTTGATLPAQSAPGESGARPQSGASSKKQNDSKAVPAPARTRERARPVHIGKDDSEDQEGVGEKKAKAGQAVEGSSLRSSQRSALTPEVIPQPSAWTPAAETKTAITLSDGTRGTAVYLSANAFKLASADVTRVLAMPAHNVLRRAMLRGFARVLRDTYVRRWCAAHGRRVQAWKDTDRALKGFEGAAPHLASEFARRSMTPDQFLDAAVELRPKAVKFPTPDMLASWLGERIAEWVPPEQREQGKPWDTREDESGQTWIHLPDEAEPIMVIRTPADRARLLQKVRSHV